MKARPRAYYLECRRPAPPLWRVGALLLAPAAAILAPSLAPAQSAGVDQRAELARAGIPAAEVVDARVYGVGPRWYRVWTFVRAGHTSAHSSRATST